MNSGENSSFLQKNLEKDTNFHINESENIRNNKININCTNNIRRENNVDEENVAITWCNIDINDNRSDNNFKILENDKSLENLHNSDIENTNFINNKFDNSKQNLHENIKHCKNETYNIREKNENAENISNIENKCTFEMEEYIFNKSVEGNKLKENNDQICENSKKYEEVKNTHKTSEEKENTNLEIKRKNEHCFSKEIKALDPPKNVYEYNHNVIYHELYIELLEVNKNLQNEIKNLKKIIEIQKELIKSKEDDIVENNNMIEKRKMSSKSFVNNNYFLNFFNKKNKTSKKKDDEQGKPDNEIFEKNEGIAESSYNYNQRRKGSMTRFQNMPFSFFSDKSNKQKKQKSAEAIGTINLSIQGKDNEKQKKKKSIGTSKWTKQFDYKWIKSINNSNSFQECECIYNDDMKKFGEIDNDGNSDLNKNNKYMKLSLRENEYVEFYDNEENCIYDNLQDSNNNNKINNKKSYTFFKDKQNSKETEKYTDCDYKDINTIKEITLIKYWYNKIIPLINDEKKKYTLIELIMMNYMPQVIKEYFWKENINNKLNITDYFVKVLIKNANFIQIYIYINNKQYYNNFSRYFKNLINMEKSSINIVSSFPSGNCFVDENELINTVKESELFKKMIMAGIFIEDDKDGSIDANENGKIECSDKGIEMNNELNSTSNFNKDEKCDKENNKKEKVEMKNFEHLDIDILQRYSIHKFFYQILIDLDRTLYIIKKNQEYYNRNNIDKDNFLFDLNIHDIKKNLNKLLQMYVIFKPELGYIQGMSYIALVFVLHCKLEKAFIHFANFMEYKNMRNLYSFNKQEIKIFLFTIKEILTKKNIEVYKEIVKHYNIDNIFIQWAYTMFLTCLPFRIFIRIFDIYTFNEKIIFETIICIFTYFNKFHSMENVDTMIKNLSSFSFNMNIQEDKFFSMLKKSRIKKRKITYYRGKYLSTISKNEEIHEN
ncbi:GTPase-activating protein, putative [Plasmodium berghei]|uniref:GTPase-activating protein, putative n=3 Tax=Plasmodium berghei TaxID=5821 RepID=A0A509ALQ3_PLABA|nr:GTPase-activating protein, putative [Plasmodium berghei ANKA]SCM16246.1 GTPase-activating protein, putative [Plasmodium berghei]SCM18042.1 GTPase-activating protein, putative [Plasmodium berghei]VUC56368.1 GTPase-activating protein, putative [Plasmodium berghei ANKA]|eukprot:XP_034422170.1 GTPase-activating protein, putative [Plasmodium berghei ANKA]